MKRSTIEIALVRVSVAVALTVVVLAITERF